MGRKRVKTKGDKVNGILLLDKPSGITSNSALQKARELLNAQKGGHTGSLDPIATGLLPLCFGTATKWSGYFLNSDKHYRAIIRLGESTDTGDSEGKIIFSDSRHIDISDILNLLEDFRGTYKQIPPMYSAIKVNGTPLYKYARQGKNIEREGREITVRKLEVNRFNGRDLELEILCSSGFYVRSLAADIGKTLGVGGHVIELKRLGVAELSIEDAVTICELKSMDDKEIRRSHLREIGQSLRHLPAVELSVDAAFYLCRGQAVRVGNLPETGQVRLYSADAGFLGVGIVEDQGTVAPERLAGSAS